MLSAKPELLPPNSSVCSPGASGGTAIHTFFADGNWSEINSFRDVNRGVWTTAGSSCLLTFEGYTFDGEGRCSGSLQVRATVDLLDGDHLAARWEQDMFDLQGRVTKRAYYGTFTGSRMVAIPV